ncbi:MAG TPA: shikimate kinase [bacterium]|nr:shikimate kinase [bacterium]
MFETTRRHIYLAGFMGTGKTAVGERLAARLGWHFIDLDAMIVALRHRGIPEIFRSEGESGFRHLESRALRLAAVSPHTVIALGGGTPLRPANVNVVRATGRCWLLTAEPGAIWDRVRHTLAERPLLADVTTLSGDDAARRRRFEEVIAPLLAERRAAYERIADFTIDTTRLSVDEVVSRIESDFHAATQRQDHP